MQKPDTFQWKKPNFNELSHINDLQLLAESEPGNVRKLCKSLTERFEPEKNSEFQMRNA
jgi:hypothetical protein